MRKTENFELNLLDGEDFVNKDVLNDNAEKIDQKLKEHDTPEYDISLQKDVENLSSGESLRVALRKIAKAVKTLIEHLANKENPHGVSAKDVGLGEVTNESKETMFTNPTFTGITNAEGYGFGDNAVHPTKVMPYEREYDNTGTTYKTTVVGINAGLHLDGDLETANFQGLASNFTTENWKMGAAAPLVKQLYEENQSLKEEISTLNSNFTSQLGSNFVKVYDFQNNGFDIASLVGSNYGLHLIRVAQTAKPSIGIPTEINQWGTLVVFNCAYRQILYISQHGEIATYGIDSRKWKVATMTDGTTS